MAALSRIGICLIVVLLITLSGLLAQLLYVLWCRRRFHLQNQNFSDQIAPHHHSQSTTTNSNSVSKELLYFFLCWNHHSRIGPATAAAATNGGGAADASLDSGDLAKWHALYGPSRALFTIDEDEREDQGWLEGSEMKKTKRVPLEERFVAAEIGGAPPVAAEAEVETPFSTPCESPLYYTPSPSPPREVTRSPGNDVTVDLEAGEL